MVNDMLATPQMATDPPVTAHAAHDSDPFSVDVSLLGVRRDGRLAHCLVVDRNGAVLFCGQALERLLGTTSVMLLGRHVRHLLPGLPVDRLLAQCGLAHDALVALPAAPSPIVKMLDTTRQAWGLGRPLARVRRIARADGAMLPVDLTYGALGVRGGRLMVLEVHLRGEAARGRLQQLVNEVERCTAVALITDAGGRIECVNQASETRFGYSAFELVGQPVAALQAVDASPAKSPPIALSAVFGAGRPWLGEMVFRDRSGEAFNEEIRVRPWAIGGGPITHFACFGRTTVGHQP